MDGIGKALVTISIGLGVGFVSLLSIIIAAPIVVGMEAGVLACGLLGLIGKYVSRRLSIKAKKHDQIPILAESKISSILTIISTALKDSPIIVIIKCLNYYQFKKVIHLQIN